MRKTLSILILSLFCLSTSAMNAESEDDFDRLDGFGRSGKKVDVVEWEGNLEIHVYPGGSTQGLALKIDDRNPNKRVMVIGYRFKNNPKLQLIRRAILGIPLQNDFQVFRDPRSGKEYDKFVITNRRLGAPWVAYRVEPGPSQLYPEGHSAIANKAAQHPSPSERAPASGREFIGGVDPESGAIRSKSW
ncbi:MAG: hypothetical protein KGQ59_03070 [Bdellovibrionales bacterium]|nr:hypothetical protein [Bdellovibrionales bacterium]